MAASNDPNMSFVSGPALLLRPVDLGGKAKSWRWLGTLKDQLSYDEDSDSDADDANHEAKSSTDKDDAKHDKFGAADEEALDRIFKNAGTLPTAERMRTALHTLAADLTQLRESTVVKEDEESPVAPPPERMSESLLTVRDLVRDRSDFARALVALGGLDVLLGCVSERDALSRKVRSSCFDLLAVLSGGNVPIQLRLLDENAVRTMAALYFAEFPEATKIVAGQEDGGAAHLGEGAREGDDAGLLRSQIVRAIDRSVMGHAGAEHRFCKSARGRRVIEAGVGHTPAVSTRNLMGGAGMSSPPPAVLKRRCLSLLQDLLTSRFADGGRFEAFVPAMTHVALRLTVPEDEEDGRVRETALELVVHALRAERKKKGVEVVKGMRKELENIGEGRMEELKTGDTEHDLWVAVLAELGR